MSYSYLHKLDPSLSILIQDHGISFQEHSELITGEKIQQEITTKFDNLGIIAVRFQTFKKSVDDVIYFRLKEKNASNWYYSASYRTDQFQDRELFPFGFPIIKNSAGKSYEIEIESLTGSDSNRIKVDTLLPVVISKYQYNLRPITFSLDTFRYILFKIINTVSSIALIFPVVFYALPLILFILSNIKSDKFPILKPVTILLPFIFLALSLPLSLPKPEFTELTIIVIWSIYLIKNRLSPNTNLIVASLFSFFILWLMIENQMVLAEEYARWTIIFLFMALVHNFITQFFGLNTKSIRDFISKNFER